MKFRKKTLNSLADMICGNNDGENYKYFVYRSSSYLTEFFEDVGTEHEHDGSTRKWWVRGVLEEILDEPTSDPTNPPDNFCLVIKTLMDQSDAIEEDKNREKALAFLNSVISYEGFQAYYDDNGICYLRNLSTNKNLTVENNPYRPLTEEELERKNKLSNYLDVISEDQLIEEVLLPLFAHLGFQKISITGHKDKALEYGKDLWMRYVLPTKHVLYFGMQAKKGKLDSNARNRAGNSNVAEVLNQIEMMLGHEIFDSESNKKVLVDHAFIIAGGEITKAAKNWLGSNLDISKRRQIMFMDRDEILESYIKNNLPLPVNAETKPNEPDDWIPF